MATLLRPAVNQTAFLKAGLMGFAGSGKTYTAAKLAIGLAQHIGDRKPVAMFDTETGSDFLIPRFKDAGIDLLVAKTRSFRDLVAFMKEAEGVASVAIIDSISHVWKELITAYTKRLNRHKGLSFKDWGPIKDEWQQFTDLYVNSKLHVLMCGRAGFEYDFQEDEDGKKELVKTGTKMKAETEMGYEPSLLLEMERVARDGQFEKGERGGWVHRCYVLKDRTDLMNGQAIDNPTFESFAPVIAFLNVGGTHVGVDTTRSSEDLFEAPDSRSDRKRRVEIVLELITDTLVEGGIAGTSKADKEAQIKHLKAAFGTSSWTAIKGMHLEELETGRVALRVALGLQAPASNDFEAAPVGADDTLPGLPF